MSYGAESPESIKVAIGTYIAPILEGTDGDQIDAAIERMDRAIKANPIARRAVETALWDGLARRLGVSVARLFGGPVRTEMPVAWTLASGGSDTDIAEAQEMIERRRHNIFKLKIGKRGVAEDVAHVARIAEAVGDRASIRVDVNQAWSFDEARRGLRGLREIGVDLVEQPINAGHLDQLKVLTDLYEIAVMADEALQGPETAMRAAAHRSAVAFAVKIGQSGGLKHCLVNSCTHRDAMGAGSRRATRAPSPARSMDQFSSQIRQFRPIDVDRTEVTICCIAPEGESQEARSRRIRQHEDFFNASDMATPNDTEEFRATQRGYAAAGHTPWNDLHRGSRSRASPSSARASAASRRRWRSTSWACAPRSTSRPAR